MRFLHIKNIYLFVLKHIFYLSSLIQYTETQHLFLFVPIKKLSEIVVVLICLYLILGWITNSLRSKAHTKTFCSLQKLILYFKNTKMANNKKSSKKSSKSAAVAATTVAAPAPVQIVAPVPTPVDTATKPATKRKSDAPVRHRTGTKALQQITKLQNSTRPVMRLKPLNEQVRSIAAGYGDKFRLDGQKLGRPWRFQRSAIVGLMHATQGVLVKFCETVRDASLHAGRKTIQDDDVLFADSAHRYPWWIKENQKVAQARAQAAANFTRRKTSASSKKKAAEKKAARKAEKEKLAVDATAASAAPPATA